MSPRRRGRVAGIVAGLVFAAGVATQEPAGSARPYLAMARSTAQWLKSREVPTEHGLAWRVGEPFGPDDQRLDLYHGTPGIVLFLLEAHHATGEAGFLHRARAGADHLIAAASASGSHGLYTGTSGVAYALWETYRRTGEARYAEAARAKLAQVQAAARGAGDGVWWGPVTDVISGSAGIGLFLLYAAREMEDPASLALARRAGLWLVEQGEREPAGLRWSMSKGSPSNYPNFSHGTAGVAFFMAQLHRATGDKVFLDAALDGARYLDAVAVDGVVFHHQPGGEDLYYLGWCHGPPGTARLFDVLFEITGDSLWRQRIDAALDALVVSGIPGTKPAGFWNNAGQCCGTAGVIECLLEFGTDPSHGALLEALIDDLRSQATTDDDGTRWVSAEHRVRPELLGAQTGYMQGAAGIGLCLLHLDGVQCGREPAIVLPDALFRDWREACRRAAGDLIESDAVGKGYPQAPESARYGGATRLRHPLLARYFADRRFYFVEVQTENGGTTSHEYFLTVVGPGREAAVAFERGGFDAFEFVKARDVRARSAEEVVAVHALIRLLELVGGGCGQSGTPLRGPALARRFGLGFPEPVPQPALQVPRVVETPSRRYAVTCGAHSDDWDMPVTLRYQLLGFDAENGRLLSAEERAGETFASQAFDEGVQERAFDAWLEELARAKH